MANKIIFGSDLIDVLENKYNMNKLAEVPTKYKNGITIIDFIYGKEKDIDDLKYNKPYVEFSINDETDGFISGTMYLNGVESVQFDNWEDLKYFVKNAKWTESKKSSRKCLKEGINDELIATSSDGEITLYLSDERQANHGKDPHYEFALVEKNGYFTRYIRCDDERCENVVLDWIKEFDLDISKSEISKIIKLHESKKFVRKSLKEGINVKIVYSDDTPSEYIDDVTHNDILEIIEESPEVYKIFDISGSKKKLVWSDEYGFERAYESKKSVKKSLKESVNGHIATDEDCNMSGKGWVLDGSYNFIMEFLQEWGIAPKDVKVKNGMTTLYNADGKPFGYVYQDGEVDIFVADKTTNWTWENHNPSTKRVKVTALDEIF